MTSLGSDQLNCDSQKKKEKNKKERSIELWKHKNINLPSGKKKKKSHQQNLIP